MKKGGNESSSQKMGSRTTIKLYFNFLSFPASPFQMHIRFYFTGDLNALLTAEITNLIWNWGF